MSVFPQPRNLNRFGLSATFPEEPHLIFHVPDHLETPLMEEQFTLLTHLAHFAVQRSIGIDVIRSDTTSLKAINFKDDHLHLLMSDEPLYGQNVVHSVPAYLQGFWFFDEIGVRNNSTSRILRFDRRAVNQSYAIKVLRRLKMRYFDENLTKFEQPERRNVDLEKNCLVFFAQYFFRPRLYKDYLTTPSMIEAAIRAKGSRKLYIKPHPLQKPKDLEWLMDQHDPKNGVEVVNANMHELIEHAAVTLSLTSAACFEGFILRKPAILGGQTDFAQNAITLHDPAKMKEAIEAAETTEWPFAQFMTWYLKHNCLEDREDQLPRALERLHKKGVAWADLDRKGFF